jgi:hypothetical protein
MKVLNKEQLEVIEKAYESSLSTPSFLAKLKEKGLIKQELEVGESIKIIK